MLNRKWCYEAGEYDEVIARDRVVRWIRGIELFGDVLGGVALS